MTILKLPISTSQAVVGAIIGAGIVNGSKIDPSSLIKIVICWIATPIGGLIFTIIFYHLFKFILKLIKPSIVMTDYILRGGLIIAGSYGAYALGANNVANVTGGYVGNLLTAQQAVILGGISIAVGVLTYSKNVMLTVGKGIVPLDAFSAFVTVVAHAVTVHIFAIIGVPVSTSQAIVGAVLGIGFIKNIEAIHFKMVIKVFSGWVSTPTVSLIISAIMTLIYIKIR
jgi:PiT family inorganic phosphate transporter